MQPGSWKILFFSLCIYVQLQSERSLNIVSDYSFIFPSSVHTSSGRCNKSAVNAKVRWEDTASVAAAPASASASASVCRPFITRLRR